MNKIVGLLILSLTCFLNIDANDVWGCGGFIKSHVPIDFSKVEVKLLTKQGILKDRTNCAPNNGYYFVPLYDKGEYLLELEPPPGWSFTPTKIALNIDGTSDLCSQGKDINFSFKGFGITGKVESLGNDNQGPQGVTVELKSTSERRITVTDKHGDFFFTPVYPGSYSVSISHPRWQILKQSIGVKVAEGHTELPPKSLVVQGYDVTGFVKGEGEPIKDAILALFQNENNKDAQVDGCNKDPINGLSDKGQFICYVTSNEIGSFTFGTVPNGKYYIKPHYKGQNIHFQPTKIEFEVNHDSVVLEKTFEIIGFSLPGYVLKTENGKPIANAKIFLNGKEIAITDKNGAYKLEKIKVGNYNLRAQADGLNFNEVVVRISPNSQKLPNLIPASFKVCGTVISDHSQTITINKIGSTHMVTTKSDSKTGVFCEYLSPGKYEVVVSVDAVNKQKGLQFYPITQTIEISSNEIPNIVFSQLKATLVGKIQCIRSQDCVGLKLYLKPNNEASGNNEIIINLEGSKYTINDVFPGNYEIGLLPNKFCWKSNSQIINVNNATVNVRAFVQIGYSLAFVSSHDTKVTFKTPEQQAFSTIEVNKGRYRYCVEKPGEYTFELNSCHSYKSNIITYNIDADLNEILLTAEKHTVKLAILPEADYGIIDVSVKTGPIKVIKQLKYHKGQYELDLKLAPLETAVIVPHSDVLYFDPPILSITGAHDCDNLGVVFKAVKGAVFKGKVYPPLSGVTIIVESENFNPLVVETDESGSYKFPPLDGSKQYKISAKKDSYILVGPNNEGNFSAHKLAEIIVEVLDEDKTPLQGALLSLSGGESYRSNLQTNQNGKITFHSLSPSEYFLRPMMKEYKFEPNSKIISVAEGQTVSVLLIGKRVAYSAFGQVISLNGEAEDNIVVVARGVGNCSHFSEESTSESSGHFRIRGLQPYCSYHIKVKGSLDERNIVERSAPETVKLEAVDHDIKNLKIIVFKPVTNMDVLVKIFSQNPEHYKTLRLKITRECSPSSIVHNTKIDTSSIKFTKDNNPGVLVHVPSFQVDGKTYSAQLESSLPNIKKNPHLQLFVANSSFKYVELDFVVKTNVTEQLIKQTSVWTLVFIFSAMFGVYNIEIFAALLKDKFNFNISWVTNLIPPTLISGNKKNTDYYNNAEIDQIVQSINNVKKKSKVKKA